MKKPFEVDVDDLPLEISNDDQNDDEEDLSDTCNSNVQKYKMRAKARIIRSVCFNQQIDAEKHYRELIMLFTSWRSENTDLIRNCSSYEEHFLLIKDKIADQMKQYAICSEDLDKIQEQLSNTEGSNDLYDYAMIAPATEHAENADETLGMQNLHPDFNETYDLSDDIGIPSSISTSDQLILNEVPDEEYRNMVQMLNKEQKKNFYHILHLMKTSVNPFYNFLSGGAGVGKLHPTKALYQAALKFYIAREGEDFHDINVLLLAPTGKAAYNIKGNTIHSSLAIPANQSLKNYKHLDSSRLNTI